MRRILDAFENAFLYFYTGKFDYSVKKQIQNPKKIYSIDNGFCTSLGFRFAQNKGNLLENFVAVELKRRGKDIYYYKEKSECDFIIKEGNEITQVIQVCYLLDNEDTKKREIKGLLEASKELKCENLLLITDSLEKKEKIENKLIIYTPLWKWLL